MSANVRLIPSGFDFVDNNWGGIYKGGSYLLVGPRKSGRTLLGLQFAQHSMQKSETCLFFTTMRPRDLMIQAATLNFDIQKYMDNNQIIVVRMSAPNEIAEGMTSDDYLIEYLNDIITIVDQYNPDRLIFDELTPFVGFRNLDLLRDVFLHTLEAIENKDINSIFLLGEPATVKAQSVYNIISENVTGVFILKKYAKKIQNKYYGGQVKIIPNVGHTEGEFEDEYSIVPKHGVITDEINGTTVYEKNEIVETTKPVEQKISKVINEQPEDILKISNIYNKNDFDLLLNNQIALYKSTGQSLNLLSIKSIDKERINFDDLKEMSILASQKKDKICFLDDMILVLIVNSSENSLSIFISELQKVMKLKNPYEYDVLADSINIHNVEVSEQIHNAVEMLSKIKFEKEGNFSLSSFIF